MADLEGPTLAAEGVDVELAGAAAPRRYRPEDTKRRVLEAASNLFSRKTYDKTSTADIASEAGVAEGSIFYHFGSKRGLLAALGRHYSEQMTLAMRGDATDLRGLDTATLVDRCFAYCESDKKNLHSGWLDEHAPEAVPYFSAGRQVVVDFVEQVLRANLDRLPDPDMDVGLAASLAFAAVHDSLHRLEQISDPREADRLKRETIRFVKAACGN